MNIELILGIYIIAKFFQLTFKYFFLLCKNWKDYINNDQNSTS